MTRAFVAVQLPDAVLDAMANRVAHVSAPGRPTSREQWHLTLQFLGDDADVDAVIAALDGFESEVGHVQVGGAGAFPDARRARVLWLGLAEGAGMVTRLAGAVIARTERLGYVRDARPFRPHITLARCSVPTDLRGAIAAIGADPVGPVWTVDAVTVYESRLRPEGAEYAARATIPIGR